MDKGTRVDLKFSSGINAVKLFKRIHRVAACRHNFNKEPTYIKEAYNASHILYISYLNLLERHQ